MKSYFNRLDKVASKLIKTDKEQTTYEDVIKDLEDGKELKKSVVIDFIRPCLDVNEW